MPPFLMSLTEPSFSTTAATWRRWAWPGWIVLCLVLVAWAAWAWREDAATQRARREIEAAASAPTRAQPRPQVPKSDFVARLPKEPADAARLAGQLQQSCRLAGVVLASLAATQHPATASELGRTQFDVELKGRYAAVKAVVAELLERDSRLTVSAFRLRVDTAMPGQVQGLFTLTAWSQPLAPAAPLEAGGR